MTTGGESRAEFGGRIGRTFADSTPWWPPLPAAPDGAPNVLVVLLDDVGFAQFGCYGSDVATPTFDRLAAGGLRYGNYHTTALCSPTRAALLTGRNHHTVGMGRIADFGSGFPGYNALMPPSAGTLAEVLVRRGYATYLVGKWHLAPPAEMQMGASREHWPLSRGFERFYGFMGGETDQYVPDLVYDNHQIDPPRTPEEGYHLTEDLADRAMLFVDDLRAAHPAKPWLLWFAPGACHAPHQVPAVWSDRYRGRFDDGWDAWRERVFARQVAEGIVPAHTRLSERPHWVPAWDSLGADERRLYARMMEVYAGFLTHTDAQVGRLVAHLERTGELDRTIVVVMSDNGASAEGGPQGSFNEVFYFNFVPERLEENLRRIDQLGTPEAHNHYPWGWAWAGNTPFRRWKRETHEGGVTDPLIVHWPGHIADPGAVRHQYVHAVDLMPTLLEAIGVEAPAEIAGVAQTPIEGVSFAHTLRDAGAASRHVTQYYEMLGSRALYHDGWKAVVFHALPGPRASYDGSDPDVPFDEEPWELYDLRADPSETTDLAASHPERLREMIELWWREAERHQVLPLNHEPGRHGDTRHRRVRYEYRPGIGAIPAAMAPNLRNRSHRIIAEVRVGDAGIDGWLCGDGGATGGYGAYVRDGRLHYTHNFLGLHAFTTVAEVPVPRGEHRLRVEFTATGRFRGDVALYYDDLPVGAGHVPATVPVFYGLSGFTVGYVRGTSPVPGIAAPCRITEGALERVIVELDPRSWRDPARGNAAAEAADPVRDDRAGLATQ